LSDPPGARKVFPGRVSHTATLIILAIVASTLYGIQLMTRSTVLAGTIDDELVIHWSMLIAGLSVILRYLTLVYRNSTRDFDVEDELKAPENQFAEKFRVRHEGKNQDER
jgi:hypothetical protein